MSDAIKRCCGTCEHWDRTMMSDGLAECGFMAQATLPFWCAGWTFEGSDHDNWTSPDAGKRCAAWQERVTEPPHE